MRVAFLTPYTGGNLGDAAIQDAVIYNVKKRFSDAELCLVTMCPSVTTRLHGIPSFPIDARPNRVMELTGQQQGIGEHLKDSKNRNSLMLAKSTVKRFPVVFFPLKWLHTSIGSCGQLLLRAKNEIQHIVKSYRMLGGVDLLLVTGGGQLDEYWGGAWAHPYALFKWGLLARVAGAKYVFLSVGACSLESALSVFFIKHALGLASYRSYRDNTSKMLLKSIAVTRSDAVYPDLAFSYDLRSMLRDTHQRRSEVVIAVSPIAYLSRYAWPVKDAAVFERYFDQLCTFICELISLGNTVLLFSTDTCDRHVVADLMARLSTKGELVKEGRLLLAYPDSPRELLEKLVNVDLVVASRLHGVLLSHLLSLPVMAISYDRKVDTYMQDMGMADYCVDIHKLDAKLLSTKFEALRLNQQDIRSQLAEKKAVYARDLQAQYERVLSRMIFISA